MCTNLSHSQVYCERLASFVPSEHEDKTVLKGDR
jgi:hypothetical protein